MLIGSSIGMLMDVPFCSWMPSIRVFASWLVQLCESSMLGSLRPYTEPSCWASVCRMGSGLYSARTLLEGQLGENNSEIGIYLNLVSRLFSMCWVAKQASYLMLRPLCHLSSTVFITYPTTHHMHAEQTDHLVICSEDKVIGMWLV